MAVGGTPQASELAQAPFWTLERIADALGDGPRGPREISRIDTDTRAITPGSCFVALRGDSFDAHDFLADAVVKGATALIVNDARRAAGLGVAVYEVGDTVGALGRLARYRRRAWGKPIVGVVGTNGKTSTKELLRAALGSVLTVHATIGNYNNLVGVPQTLFALPDDADVAVIEMGTNHPGEVAALRDVVEANIIVITSIAEEHLEGLGDLEGVLREEVSACEHTALAITPAAQPEVGEAARKLAGRVIDTGLDAGDFRPDSWGIGPDGQGTLRFGDATIHVPLRGTHNLRNAMIALAVAREAGVSLTDAGNGIAGMTPPPMRVNFESHGGAMVINDAYNSNPGSARAALDLLEHAGAGKQRVAVLGSMLELGPHADRLHDEVARHALAARFDVIAGVGEFADALRRVGADDERIVIGADAEAAWTALRSRLAPNAVILLKGSRGVRLERMVPLIAAWSAARTAGE
jgi:UDP-N-acetylmuramoyl-tripeptide--D-alanyl-D-alanine ligase